MEEAYRDSVDASFSCSTNDNQEADTRMLPELPLENEVEHGARLQSALQQCHWRGLQGRLGGEHHQQIQHPKSKGD